MNPVQAIPMNENTLKVINNLISRTETGVAIGGPQCVGKSHLAKYLKRQGSQAWSGKKFPKLSCNSKDIPEKGKGVILVGVPFSTWEERCILRMMPKRTKHNGFRFGAPGSVFKQFYVDCINKFEEYNIPYILIDYRNEGIVLDKSSFLTMLYSS